ncbi:flagellar basal-body MS-ring/collar protein FliF [Aestuariivirga litoralis]|uniref:flagellar basal-body MS-ring/collar protein FliF n=1 Tax=Aestuariivirga litoralis TaxID=2650924 RepID=UPI0018C45BD5|nr:flagellar basal-body MS-ring/collar protein FliF [Aestuariivirga litoralis]
MKLGLKRGIPLLVALAVFAGLLTASFVLFNKPVRQVLYSGLTPDDVNQIGMVLSESNVPFDVNEAGTSVLVDYGKTAQARMILAEKGLPKSDKSGYALFDQMGSLGLTSFMQQITRVRALEGELVRTIQQLDGIKTARVHLALKPDNTFKTKEDQPTASVVIRTIGRPAEQTIMSIRQIVAAAIPGMLPDHVTVMTTDGTLLNAGTAGGSEQDKMLDLQKSVSSETQDRIERTLAPVAGMSNVRVSVTTELNTDKRQINQTNFDPESKVERSMRTVKSSDQSSDSGNGSNISVDQNIPQEVKPGTAGGGADSKKKESKEETVNYELNSVQTATESQGFRIEKQSIAVVINKQALAKLLGGANGQVDQSKLDAQVKDIEDTVKTAAGYDEKRGDTIHVTAVDFAPEDATLEPLAGPSFVEILKGNLGTMINALALIITAVVVLMLGVKPVLKFLAEIGPSSAAPPMLGGDMGGMGNAMGSLPMGGNSMGMPATADFGAAFGLSDNPSADDPRARLNRVVGGDVNRAAQVMKQWLADGANEAA